MPATIRYRGGKSNIVELAKTLDAFKKVPEKYTETTEIGGTLSLLSRLLVIYLIYKEVNYYRDSNLVFRFKPDIEMDDKVQLHVDITVAMPCASLSGVDLIDETQQDVFAYGTLQREGVWWKMKPDERENFQRMQHINSFLREEYHSVADILFKDIIKSPDIVEESTVLHKPNAEEQYDSCRLHGTLGINKVAGVLHLVAASSPIVELIEDHWLLEFRKVPSNFSHRINRFSFGQLSRRIVQPLEGDERFIDDESTTIQYFIKIVPTEIHNAFSTINTFQYSVTENVRKLDTDQNSYGSPGIYFKYDWSALKIVVRSDRDNIAKFIIRLCSIISGIIVISGILNSVLVTLQRTLIRLIAPGVLNCTMMKKSQQNSYEHLSENISTTPTTTKTGAAPANNLISTANKMSNLTIGTNLITSKPII